MKSTIRLATTQFCYIEFEVEGSVEDIIAEEKRIQKLYQGSEGLPEKEFNRVLDNYIWKDDMLSTDYEVMSLSQQDIIQVIKRSKKRRDYKLV